MSVTHIVRVYWPADSEGNEGGEARYEAYCGKMIFAEIEDYETNNKAWKDCDCEACLCAIVVHIIKECVSGAVKFCCGEDDLVANSEFPENYDFAKNSQWRKKGCAPTPYDCARCVKACAG